MPLIISGICPGGILPLHVFTFVATFRADFTHSQVFSRLLSYFIIYDDEYKGAAIATHMMAEADLRQMEKVENS